MSEMPAAELSQIATSVTRHGATGSGPVEDSSSNHNQQNSSDKPSKARRFFRRLGWKNRADPSQEPLMPMRPQYGGALYRNGLQPVDQTVRMAPEAVIATRRAEIEDKRYKIEENLRDTSPENRESRLNDIRQNNWMLQRLLGDPLSHRATNPLFATIYERERVRAISEGRARVIGDPDFVNDVLGIYEDTVARGMKRPDIERTPYIAPNIIRVIGIKGISFRADGEYLQILSGIQRNRAIENEDNVISSLLPQFKAVKDSPADSPEQIAAIAEIKRVLEDAGIDNVDDNFMLIWAAVEGVGGDDSETDRIKRAISLDSMYLAQSIYEDRLMAGRAQNMVTAAIPPDAPDSPDNPSTPDAALVVDPEIRYPLPDILNNVELLTDHSEISRVRELAPVIERMSSRDIQAGIIYVTQRRRSLRPGSIEFWSEVVSVGQDERIAVNVPDRPGNVFSQYMNFIRLLGQDPEYRDILETVSDAPNPDIQNTPYYWSLPPSGKREEIANTLDRCYRASEIYVQRLGIPDFLQGAEHLNGTRSLGDEDGEVIRLEGPARIERVRSILGELFSSGRVNNSDFRETVQQVLRGLAASGGRLDNRIPNPDNPREYIGNYEVNTEPGSIRFWEEVNQMYWRQVGRSFENHGRLLDPEPLTPDELRNDHLVDEQIYRLAAQDPEYRRILGAATNRYDPNNPSDVAEIQGILANLHGGDMGPYQVTQQARDLFRCQRALQTYLIEQVGHNFIDPNLIQPLAPLDLQRISGRVMSAEESEQVIHERLARQATETVGDVIAADEVANQEDFRNLDIPAIEATDEYQELLSQVLRAFPSDSGRAEARRIALNRYLAQKERRGNERLRDEEIDQLLEDHIQNKPEEDRRIMWSLNEPDAQGNRRLTADEVNSLLERENQINPEVLGLAERSIPTLAIKSPAFLVQSLLEQGQTITQEQAQAIFEQMEREGKVRKITVGAALRGSYTLIE